MKNMAIALVSVLMAPGMASLPACAGSEPPDQDAVARAQDLAAKEPAIARSLHGSTAGASTQNVTPQNTPSARAVFSQIARETGGMSFYMPNATAQEYADAFVAILENVTEDVPELRPGVPVTGLAGAANDWRTFRVKVPEGTQLLRVFTSGGQGDVSLYVRHQTSPTAEMHDASSVRPGNTELINVSHPQPGDWYVRVQGEVDFSGVSLQVAY